MAISVNEIREASKDKKNGPSAFLIIIVKPLGDYVAWFCLRLGLTPMQVTYFDFFLVITACLMFALLGPPYRILASVFLIIWQLLDVVDGNMARVLKCCSDYGGFVDHICGMFLLAFLQLSIGIGLYFHPENSAQELFYKLGINLPHLSVYILICGACSSVAAILIRLLHQTIHEFFGSEMFTEYECRCKDTGDSKLSVKLIRFARNFERLGSLQIIIIFMASLFRCMELVVLAYFILNCGMLIGYTGKALVSLKN